MATCCHLHGIVGVSGGRPYSYSPKKNFWKHDAFLPLASGELPVELYTFGGHGAPLDDGVYSGVACVVMHSTVSVDVDATEPTLQLFARDEFVPLPPFADAQGVQMPRPIFTVAGKVSRANVQSHVVGLAFDLDVSQFAAQPQQLIRVRCYYPQSPGRFAKTPHPDAGKHVVLQGVFVGFDGNRCLIEVRDIAFGPTEGFGGPAGEAAPPAKLTSFDWTGKTSKRKKEEKKERPSIVAHYDESNEAEGSSSKALGKRRSDTLEEDA